MEIRPCSAQDLARLQAGWPIPGSDIHAAHFAAQQTGSAAYLVAWRGGLPVGSGMVQWGGCVGPHARSAHPGCIEFNHLQVRPEELGSGVGSALIAAAEDLIRWRGHPEVGIGVAADNPAAAALYRRLGYELTGVRDTIAYTWFDGDGAAHDEIEHDELLVKALRDQRRTSPTSGPQVG